MNLLIIYVKFICDILAANNKQKIHTYSSLVIILTDLNHAARFPLFVTSGSDGVQFFFFMFLFSWCRFFSAINVFQRTVPMTWIMNNLKF